LPPPLASLERGGIMENRGYKKEKREESSSRKLKSKNTTKLQHNGPYDISYVLHHCPTVLTPLYSTLYNLNHG
jgi:hypothetical protein